jgi:N-acetyldiaminopimelate deacetylase
MTQSWVELRRQLHRIPEPGFEEFKTQAHLLERIAALPQEHLEVQTWRTGILVFVHGTNPRCTFGYRTDMDGLPIEEQTSYDFKSEHPGFMHACGHDMHMTIATALLTHFASHPLADNLLFIFQPAEEGPGGAEPMMHSDEFAKWRPDEIFALHIAPEYPVGTVAIKPGILFANTSELFIHLKGLGGHAAFPHKTRDMVVAAAHLVTQLQTVVARNVDPIDSAVVTIGQITSGQRQNIIAEEALLAGTIRSLSDDTMQLAKRRISAIVSGIEAAFECEAEIDWGANYKQVWNHEQQTREFMSWLQDSGTAQLIESPVTMTGEDFGYFLGEIPGFLFWLGVDTPYGLHHAKIEPSEAAIDVAVRVVSQYLTWKSNQ